MYSYTGKLTTYNLRSRIVLYLCILKSKCIWISFSLLLSILLPLAYPFLCFCVSLFLCLSLSFHLSLSLNMTVTQYFSNFFVILLKISFFLTLILYLFPYLCLIHLTVYLSPSVSTPQYQFLWILCNDWKSCKKTAN